MKSVSAILILSYGERRPLAYDGGKFTKGVLRIPGGYEIDGAKLLSFKAHIITNRPKLVCRALGVEYPHSCVWAGGVQ
jgi:hypothetical protein